ncbi:MAG: adenosylcobinamide-GDP ribazoletransferase [Actinomycetota bacterium]|nr:adenosylcobinamide-GDP ribazoletransferase [Actinomycetota bacterium]
MGLLAALQFLTRVPIRLRREPSLPATVAWFPLAGALIGAAVGGVAAGMWQLAPPLVAATVAITIGLLITGAFHEDGLGDVADAFGGGWTVERRLEILKDSRHGTYGVAAMCASIVVRMVALGSLPGPATMFAAAIAAHTMGRVAAVGMAGTMRLATHTGLGADYGRGTTPLRATVGGAAGVALTALAVGWWVGPLATAALATALATGALARRKIGGISGDVLGAAEQVAECLCLVVLSGLATHHQLWWA